jgi:signal transduction histidine kinase
VRALRTLLVDIYPPSLQRAGLAAALGDLATMATSRGIDTKVDVPNDDVHLGATVEQLLFRCAQEALRNAQKHAGAMHLTIRLREEAETAILEVIDDGKGFDLAVLERRREEGHFGLRALEDLVSDAGGQLQVHSEPGQGTTVRVEVPK